MVDLVGSEALDEGLVSPGEVAVERLHADAAVPAEVVVVAEPWFETFPQSVEGGEVPVGQSGQEAEADGAEEALDLAA